MIAELVSNVSLHHAKVVTTAGIVHVDEFHALELPVAGLAVILPAMVEHVFVSSVLPFSFHNEVELSDTDQD